jgi:hypothetical protein
MPNFPGSLDSFTNPTGSTALAGAGQLLHSAEHATTNDILLALETKLGQNPAAADSLGYVYTGDGTNKGLWVPSGAMLSPGLLLNSNFDVWQKGGGATPAPTTQNTTTSYCADRFFVLPAGASVTVSLNSTTAPNSRSNCTLAVTGAVGVTTVDIGQRVRSRTILNQAKQSLVFSCWIFNNTGSAFTPTLLVNTPNALDNFAGTTVQLTQALQSCPNFAWTRVFHVFNPSAYTNINNGMQISVQIPSGALTAGTKAVLLGQFDLRPGNHLMEYYPPSAYLELLQCREYCQVLTSDSTYNAPFGAGHWSRRRAALRSDVDCPRTYHLGHRTFCLSSCEYGADNSHVRSDAERRHEKRPVAERLGGERGHPGRRDGACWRERSARPTHARSRTVGSHGEVSRSSSGRTGGCYSRAAARWW